MRRFLILYKREKFSISIIGDVQEESSTHSEVEIIYVLEGSAAVQVEQKTTFLKADDILVINANKRHSVKTADNPLIMKLLFDYMMISEKYQGQDVIFWCNSAGSENDRYQELRTLLKRLAKHYVEAEDFTHTFRFQADCYAILDHLTANYMMKAVDVEGYEEGDRYEERLAQINNYINSNYDQAISMKDLSEKLYLSNGYLSRFFKKNYGMSFANYLTNVRVLHAVDELLYTDIPVTRVAYDCGFTSAALFNKVFKKAHGVTPTEFRRQAGGKETEKRNSTDEKAIEKRLEKTILKSGLEDDDKDSGSMRIMEDTFDVSESREVPQFWGDTINFGNAEYLLHSSIREHLMILKSALNFTYVRFWSIFSKEFYVTPEQTSYDFSQIDSVLDFVIEQGMKPFIELGMKPKTIHFEVGKAHKEYAEYFNLEQWERLIHAFMRHLTTRYGQHMLDGWRMELWFDEDMRPSRKNWDEYYDRFDITWRAIKETNEKIMLGGYGIRMDYGEEDREEFLKNWSSREAIPDFVSIMYYGYERGHDGKDMYARRVTDNENFIHFLRREKAILRRAGMGNLPVYICEWNFTPSVRNILNDTTFKGAYILKNIIDVYGEVDAMGYGAGSDRMYASYDTEAMLFGGTGLITKEAVLKPAAFALYFLERMFPYFIGKTANYMITTDRHNNYSIVCHNQHVLNYNYFLTAETAVDKENIWKYFEGKQALKLNIHMDNITPGWYRVKTYRINEKHGSVLDIWGEMGYENELSRNDIKYIRKICEPYMNIRKMQFDRSNVVVDEILQPNEICLIRILYIGEDA